MRTILLAGAAAVRLPDPRHRCLDICVGRHHAFQVQRLRHPKGTHSCRTHSFVVTSIRLPHYTQCIPSGQGAMLLSSACCCVEPYRLLAYLVLSCKQHEVDVSDRSDLQQELSLSAHVPNGVHLRASAGTCCTPHLLRAVICLCGRRCARPIVGLRLGCLLPSAAAKLVWLDVDLVMHWRKLRLIARAERARNNALQLRHGSNFAFSATSACVRCEALLEAQAHQAVTRFAACLAHEERLSALTGLLGTAHVSALAMVDCHRPQQVSASEQRTSVLTVPLATQVSHGMMPTPVAAERQLRLG